MTVHDRDEAEHDYEDDLAYEIEEGEEVAATTVVAEPEKPKPTEKPAEPKAVAAAKPANGSAVTPKTPFVRVPGKRRAAAPVDLDDPLAEATRAAEAEGAEAERELARLRLAARSTVHVRRTAITPGSDCDSNDTGDVPGVFPITNLEASIRGRAGGGNYRVSGTDAHGKSFDYPLQVSGKSRPLHPEEDDGDVGVFLDQGVAPQQSPLPVLQAQQPPQRLVPLAQDQWGNTVWGPPGGPPLPPHMQPPPGWQPSLVAPAPVHPLLEELRAKLKSATDALDREREAHAVTRTTLEKERAQAREDSHKAELRQLRAEQQAELKAMEARLSALAAPKEDPQAALLKYRELDQQAQREFARDLEKQRDAAQQRMEALLAKLGERPAETAMDKLLHTLVVSMVEARQDAQDPLKQVELVERLAAISGIGGGGKGEEEEGGTAEQLIRGVARVLNAPTPPFAQVAPAVTYAPAAGALPASAAAPVVPAPAASAPSVPNGLSQDNMATLILIDQIYLLVQSQQQQPTTGAVAAGRLKAWATANGYTQAVVALGAQKPQEVHQLLQGAAANPLIPSENKQRIAHLATFLAHPQTGEWVSSFWAEIQKP